MSLERFLFGVVALLSLFILPWWGAGVVLLVLLIRFIPYYEVFIFSLLLDALYAPVSGFGFMFTFAVAVLFFAFLFLRDRMRIV